MYRASTPQQKFILPFDVNQYVEKLLITYTQDEIVFEKKLVDVKVEGNTIFYDLTQEETNLFNSNKSVKLEIRVKTKNGKVLPSKTYILPVYDVLNDEVL